MDLVQRSFSGHSFRPRPHIDLERSTNTLIITTSWGKPETAQEVVEIIREQLSASSQPESTRIGPYIEGLSEDENRLRSSLIFANEQLYLKENSDSYNAAVEITLISRQKKNLSWSQLGTPHILLQTQNGFQPLSYSPDWSWQLQQDTPLVSKALGIEKSCHPQCGNYRLQGGENLVLISRSSLPSTIYTLKTADLMKCSETLVEDSSDAPFWMGVVEF